MAKDCNARTNMTIPCEGEYMKSQGLCLRHACLFDIWIAEHGGWRVYRYKGNPVGENNPPALRAWKRSKFHEWLNTLTIAQVDRMLKTGGRKGEW